MFSNTYIQDFTESLAKIDQTEIENLIKSLVTIREKRGRLFLIGVGGSAANCSHAVNDFRKLAGIEAYSPTDNVAELTARINDEGWESSFAEWLKASNLNENDAIFVLSVGGGNLSRGVSVNICQAIDLSKSIGAKVFGIVGRDGGHTYKHGDAVILVPTTNEDLVTPFSESLQAVLWHLLVSDPRLKINPTKW